MTIALDPKLLLVIWIIGYSWVVSYGYRKSGDPVASFLTALVNIIIFFGVWNYIVGNI